MSNISSDIIYPEQRSNVAWGAVIGGAIAASTVSLLLVILGAGFGLTLTFPWQESSVYIKDLTIKTAIWLIIIQWLASAFGGYLTGRLSIKWIKTSIEDSFFRDTVHGFLAWSLATIVTVTILSSVIISIMGGTHTLSGFNSKVSDDFGNKEVGLYDPLIYYADILLRTEKPDPAVPELEIRDETARILINAVKNDEIYEPDRAYLVRVISSRTDLSSSEASKKIDEVIERVKESTIEMRQNKDSAMKITAHIAIYTFLSMLIGAFIASVAAAIGGRHRDE